MKNKINSGFFKSSFLSAQIQLGSSFCTRKSDKLNLLNLCKHRKKKSIFLFVLALIFSFSAYSQNVGIASTAITPNASSMLEIQSSNKGLLIPRIALTTTTAASPITSPATSLLIYNTATVSDVAPGYYYWDGSKWVRLLSSQSEDWTILGNTGTNPSTNFIGTKDVQDFVIKTNNVERARILSAGNVLVNTTTAPIPTNASATATFTTQVSGIYDIGIYGYGNDPDKIPIMAEQKNASQVAHYAINSAANGTGGGGALMAYSGQTGTATLSSGLQNSNTYSPTAISGSVSDGIAGGKGVIGVCNNATGVGIQGQSSGTNGYGIAGYGTGTGANSAGVFGHNANGSGTGVWGQTTSATGSGVVGINGAATGTSTGNGVEGETAQQKGLGILGTNLNSGGTAIGGVSYYTGTPYLLSSGAGGSFKAPKVGVFGWAYNYAANNIGGAFVLGNNSGDLGNYFAYVACNIGGTNYKIYGTGSVSTIVDNPNKSKAVMFCPEAPEILLQDYGVGQMQNGKAHIKLDPILSNNILVDENSPMKVFIQLEDECNGVYVTNKTKNGFDVIELKSGMSNAKFAWSIIATRADVVNPETKTIDSKHVGVRFPEAKMPLKLLKEQDNPINKDNENPKSRIRTTNLAKPTE